MAQERAGELKSCWDGVSEAWGQMEKYRAIWESTADLAECPWFLDPARGQGQETLFSRLGFPRARRELALAGLVRLFPPSVCIELRDRRRSADLPGVSELFIPTIPTRILPYFQVGCDLARLKGHDLDWLLFRLRQWRQFRSAAFELRVLANLVSAGCAVQRVPEMPPRKTPDFIVNPHGERIGVEVKLVDPADFDNVAEVVGALVWPRGEFIPGLKLRLVGSEELTSLVHELVDESRLTEGCKPIAEAFGRAFEVIRAGGSQPGRYSVGPYGFVEAMAEEGDGSVVSDPLPEVSLEKQASRVVRLIKKCTAQLRECPGIAVIGLYHEAEAHLVREALWNEERRSSLGLSACRAVVLIDFSNCECGKCGRFSTYFTFSGSQYRHVNKTHEKLCRVVARLGDREAVNLESAWASGDVLSWNTCRPKREIIPLGRFDVKAPGD